MLFRDIRGQQRPVSLLMSAIVQDRIAHAYAFHGLDGVGKHTAALAFAAAVNCLARTGGDACGVCRSCLKIERGSHPDVVSAAPDGAFIRIKEIREIQNRMMYRPSEGRYRVSIILEADRMNAAAANALLKTLEEPSGSNILVLVTARLYQLPATVLSRCQKIKFNPLRSGELIAILEERFGAARDEAQTLAAISGGSIGKALEMKDGDFAARRGQILERVSAISTPLDFYSVLACFGSDREGVTEGLEILKMYFRDLLVFSETGDSGKVFNRDRIDIIKNAAERTSRQQMLGSIRTINKALRAMEQNANRQLLLEMTMFNLFRTNVRASAGARA